MIYFFFLHIFKILEDLRYDALDIRVLQFYENANHLKPTRLLKNQKVGVSCFMFFTCISISVWI